MTNQKNITGVILAGGKGTRLYPLTHYTSKQLLTVGNVPMVVRAIEQLSMAGIQDFIVIIDDIYAAQYMKLLRDGKHLGLRSLGYVWQSPESHGLPSTIKQAEHLIHTDLFIVACGDVLFDHNLTEIVHDFISQKSGMRMVATKVDDVAGYSALDYSDQKITKIKDKDPSTHEPGAIDLGLYMYRRDVFDRINHLTPSQRNETEIWDLNRQYVDEGLVFMSIIDGWWSDAGGSIETYLDANRHYDEKG